MNSTIDMISDQGTIALRLADVREHQGFVDEVEMDGLLIRTTHDLQPLPGGLTQVTSRMKITDEYASAVGAELGPQISGDFPDTVAAPIRHAPHCPRDSLKAAEGGNNDVDERPHPHLRISE